MQDAPADLPTAEFLVRSEYGKVIVQSTVHRTPSETAIRISINGHVVHVEAPTDGGKFFGEFADMLRDLADEVDGAIGG